VIGNNVTWLQVTGSDKEVASFDRKSPGSGWRWPKTRIYCTFPFLQGCSSQEEAVTWQEMTSSDLRWPEVTQKWRHLTRSHLKAVAEDQKLANTVHFTSYKAVARRRRLSRDRKWCDETSGDRKWGHLAGSHLEVSEESWTLAYTDHFTSYKAVARRRQSRDGKWRHVTSDVRKWRHLTGSHLEEIVEGRKLAYTVHIITYKAVAERRQSRDRKWRHVNSDERKRPGTDVIWLEVTWKWLWTLQQCASPSAPQSHTASSATVHKYCQKCCSTLRSVYIIL